MNWNGLDIGGANIKLVTGRTTRSVAFPLWQKPAELSAQLDEILQPIGNGRIALTMTGELADCFENKAEGVAFIIRALCDVVSSERVFVYQTTGNFATPADAITNWRSTAASNWHGLATYAARFLPDQTGIVIDIGSTTTDLIPVARGVVASDAKTDWQRLQAGELVYTGVSRTPLCSLIRTIEIDAHPVQVANELFATILDAHLLAGNIEPSPLEVGTADGNPATIECATRRLARMVCADVDEVNSAVIQAIADDSLAAQREMIQSSLEIVKTRFPECLQAFLVCGSGDWLAKQVLGSGKKLACLLELAKLESPGVNICAPAMAVATLAEERNI